MSKITNIFASSYKQIDKAMFLKWKSGDKEAWNKAFEWIYCRFYDRAFIISRIRCYDDITAEQKSVDVLWDTFTEIDQKVKEDKVEWRGEKAFSSYVWKRIYWKLQDEIKKWLKEKIESIFTPPASEEEDEGEEIIIPDDRIIPGELDQPRERVSSLYGVLSTLRDEKLDDHCALKETVGCIIQYFELKLTESVVDHPNPENLRLDELLDSFDPAAFQFKKRKLYDYIVEELGITRDVLYQRMNDIRTISKKEYPKRDF